MPSKNLNSRGVLWRRIREDLLLTATLGNERKWTDGHHPNSNKPDHDPYYIYTTQNVHRAYGSSYANSGQQSCLALLIPHGSSYRPASLGFLEAQSQTWKMRRGFKHTIRHDVFPLLGQVGQGRSETQSSRQSFRGSAPYAVNEYQVRKP